MKQPRILLLQFKRLGDTLLAEPLVRSLREAGWETTWLDRESNRAAVEMLGADCIRVWPEGPRALRELGALRGEKFDAVLDLGGTDRCGFVGAFCGARRKIAFERFAKRPFHRFGGFEFVASRVWNQHTIDHFLNLLTPLGVPRTEPAHPRVSVSPGAHEAAEKLLRAEGVARDYAVLHVGAARPEKFWQEEKWVEVARTLRERFDLEVVLTGSPGGMEAEARKALCRAIPELKDLGGRASLKETAAIYADARLVVTVDSMSGHLAPAVGAPTLVLFGPMNPCQWAPRQPGCRALRGGHSGGEFLPTDPEGSMEALSAERVIAEITAMLGERESSF